MMSRIAEQVERDQTYRSVIDNQRSAPEPTGADAIAAAAREMAEYLEVAAIVCGTSSGATALRVARERPKPPIIAVTPNVATARRLGVVWGVHAIVTSEAKNLDELVERATFMAVAETFANPGQRIVIVAGVPLGTPGATNMLRIARTPAR